MSDQQVIEQGKGRASDCPLCGDTKLYIFAVGGLQFASCGSCNATVRRLEPTLTIGQIKGALVARYRQ